MASGFQSLARIKKEYREVKNATDAGITAEIVNDDFTHWKGRLEGPKGSPYEGGIFQVDIEIPKNYPFVPPKMRFDTKVWHPNISSANGAICLDILKNEWSPALTLRTALLSLQALLSTPNADDPQDAQVAGQYKSDRKAFENTAKYWTETFANPKKSAPSNSTITPEQQAKVNKLTEMGFPPAKCVEALTKHKWDEITAIDFLFTSSQK